MSELKCLLDGEIVLDRRIRVNADGALVTHGEGLFETLPVIAGRPRFLSEHLQRLDEGCRRLGFGAGPDESLVRAEIDRLSGALGITNFTLRLTVFRDDGVTRRLLVANPLPEDVGHPVALGIVSEWLNGPRSLAELKTLNYLVPRLAHAEGVKRGYDEVIFTLADGRVLEGTRSSVFVVMNGEIVTAPLSFPILPGVTREVILRCARREGVPVSERGFTVSELRASGEAFISASVRGVRAVRSLEGTPLANVDGALTRRIAALYAKEVAAA
jgi:branched-subunit amino acid aminotransferase/4-amino-4-deoxychorismate lyase